MSFFKLLLAFSPWLSFLVIARGSLDRLKLGLVVALALSVAMGVARLHRGIILWVGLLFFAGATLAVFVFNDMWTVRHMGVLANGALAASTWLTVLIGRPFTMDYAKEHTDPSIWDSPVFLRRNRLITSVWGLVFTVNTALAWGKMEEFMLSGLAYELAAYAFLVSTVAFTCSYSTYLKRVRELDGEKHPVS